MNNFIPGYTFVDEKTDELAQCECGHKPDHYSIGHGRTPYSVQCKCGKRTNKYRSMGGHGGNIIAFWNEIAPLKELDELTYDVDGVRYTWKQKLELRRLILDERKEVSFAFENGLVKMTQKEMYETFLWKGTDY